MRQEVTQELKYFIKDTLQNVHTVLPGKIVTFDADKCEATVKPTAKFRMPDDSQRDFPDIFEVPVFFPQAIGQKATFVHVVRPDDECILFFMEQPLDLWRTGAESPIDLRHDLTNAIAFVGFFAQPNPLVKRACDNESIIIQRENSFVELFDKKIEVETDGDIYITAADNITEEAGQNICIKAGQNKSVEAGVNITVEAGVDVIMEAGADVTVKAGGNMTLEAAGEMTLKAANIHLNP